MFYIASAAHVGEILIREPLQKGVQVVGFPGGRDGRPLSGKPLDLPQLSPKVAGHPTRSHLSR
jgi:hypothetical protein